MNLEQRIKRLERSNRMWKAASIGAVVVGVFAGLTSSSNTMSGSYAGVTSHNGLLIKMKLDGTMYKYSSSSGWTVYSGG